jgi:hypothetical protein
MERVSGATPDEKAMMRALLFFFEALFCLKIAWNLLTPYVLATRMLSAEAKRARGISLAPGVEVVLLVLALIGAFVARGTSSFQSPTRIATWGVLMIVASYVHLLVGGALAGGIVALIKRRREGK